MRPTSRNRLKPRFGVELGGKALVFPRALLPQVKARPELAQTGVYLL